DLGPLTEIKAEKVDEEVPSPAYFAMFTLPSDGGDDIEAAELAVDILGGGSGSRLYDRMVRRDQIATEVWAGVTRLAAGPSLALVEAIGPDTDKIAEVLDEELARFAEEGPDADETARATAQAERGFLEQTETVTGLANALSQNATQFGDPARVFTAPERAASVTADQITAMARRWLAPGARTVLTYGGAS
ncbi:MAG: insulinase family protein, partial [Actinomadura rubrobrunea]|nr:insulinase family protein [Actinomadura rubrobrunea]